MKKTTIWISAFALIAAISCKGQPEVKEKAKEAVAAEIPVTTGVNEAPVHITKAEFLSLVMDYEKNPEAWSFRGSRPCLVDFYADWCAPCKMTSPILEELAKEYAGRVDIYKVDVDQERELASVFGVSSIPTFLFCPMKGNPTLSSGIAGTAEATKEMFRAQLNKMLEGQAGTSL